MDTERPLRVPVGRDAERWRTFPGERTLVVAARTVVSTTRVLECLPAVLRDDSRVSVVFAYDPTSAFNDGVLDLLHDSGCRVMPWSQLGDVSPDLVLTASENVDVPEGTCPVLVLPHGIGFQKYVPDSRADRVRLSGLVPDALLEAGRAWLATSHPDQDEQVLAAHPKAAGRTLLVGDPCFDELAASAALRPAYRSALGVGDDRRLVVVSSTWGPTSLLGEHPDLPARLLAALPHDTYRVAAIVHPNVWAAHGAWQLRRNLAAALDAGLLLVPPAHAWRSVLLASDLVVGDHGSVTLYGAALGRPVLLGAFGSDSVPGTAAEVLGRHAPRLVPGRDARGQVEAAFEPAARAGYAGVAERAFSEPGRALVRLRAVLYELLRLPEPSSGPPPVRALAPVRVPAEPVTSWRVRTRVTVRDAGRARSSGWSGSRPRWRPATGRSPPVCSSTSPVRTRSATCGPPRARRSSWPPRPQSPWRPRRAGSTRRWPPGRAASRPRSRSARAAVWWACATAGSSRRPAPTARTAPNARRRSCTRTCAPVSP